MATDVGRSVANCVRNELDGLLEGFHPVVLSSLEESVVVVVDVVVDVVVIEVETAAVVAVLVVLFGVMSDDLFVSTDEFVEELQLLIGLCGSGVCC